MPQVFLANSITINKLGLMQPSRMHYSSGSARMVPGLEASEPHGNFKDKEVLGPHFIHTESGNLSVGPTIHVLTSPPGSSDAC